ncbi:MAG: hypothetical protein HC869_16365 [Rhodospirillales bacterium]|nr:hypothetical protein [Rhodospirillales bacterium]
MNENLWEAVGAQVARGELGGAVQHLEERLSNCSTPRFKALIGGQFSNDPRHVAEEISQFISACEKSFEVKAVYLEMNGFDINPHRWYFDLFGYKTYVDNAETFDWLSEWDSDHWPDVTLTGLENVQGDFVWYSSALKTEDADEAVEFAIPLVMCKFAGLIAAATSTGIVQKHIPIFATAHDFDIIPKIA